MIRAISRCSHGIVLAAILTAGLLAGGITQAQEPGQQTFATAADAVTALVNAVRSGDQKAMLDVLGASAGKLVRSGDPVADKNAGAKFLALYDAKNSLTQRAADHMELVVGPDDWPLPVPLVQANGRWFFDSDEATEILVNRRIGRNELMTIRTLLAGVEAQRDYFDRYKAGTGAGAYAQRVMSTAGRTDGLYWPVDQGDTPSPLGPLVDSALDEGYPGYVSPGGKPMPYHGYFFRILKAQGPNAPGGAKSYVRNGMMNGGFAFLAWPAEYGNSGIVSFMVGPDGVVYQKDLGRNTAGTASATASFNPDLTWARVDLRD